MWWWAPLGSTRSRQRSIPRAVESLTAKKSAVFERYLTAVGRRGSSPAAVVFAAIDCGTKFRRGGCCAHVYAGDGRRIFRIRAGDAPYGAPCQQVFPGECPER